MLDTLVYSWQCHNNMPKVLMLSWVETNIHVKWSLKLFYRMITTRAWTTIFIATMTVVVIVSLQNYVDSIVGQIIEQSYLKRRNNGEIKEQSYSTATKKQNNAPLLQPITGNITADEIRIMKRRGWSSAVVLKQYKLLFLPIEKNGCTQWKQLFHIMLNYSVPLNRLHNPKTNKLEYLLHMNVTEVRRILSDPTWTIATVVREPRSRLLSGYFHMKRIKRFEKNITFAEFVYYVRNNLYKDVHWEPQARFPGWMYKHMVIGKFENMQEFGKELLTKIGAWDEFGHKWGKYRNETLFSEVLAPSNRSNETKKIEKYYTKALEDEAFKMFHLDFLLFNYPMSYVSTA